MNPLLITVVQGDQGFDLNFTLTDAQGNVVNLTAATLYFNCQSVSDFAVKFKNPMIVVSAANGTCKYTVQPNDFLVAGTYNVQIVVTYGSGETVSFSDITLVVEPVLPVT